MAKRPTNPSSSPITAKIESVDILGKNLYFWSELAKPFPKRPPEEMANII